MLLGGTVVGSFQTPADWEALLVASRFRSVTAPFNCETPRAQIDEYCAVCRRRQVTIAEIGVWRNLFDPDPKVASEALSYAKGQLALADELDIRCCVNIAGTASCEGWDAADRSNFTPETYDRIVQSIRDIIDSVNPTRAFYCLEPMPWMVPDGPDEYLKLIHDVDRRQFAAHMDFVNMINCPRRYLAAEAFIEECFRKLAPFIKSTHIKDTKMHPTRLTTLLEECSPGDGALDYAEVLRIMDRWLPPDAPVLLEHMSSFDEYSAAYDVVSEKARAAGIVL